MGLENLHALKSVFDMIKLLYSQIFIGLNSFRLYILLSFIDEENFIKMHQEDAVSTKSGIIAPVQKI